jgi:ElaB/YqjD/DUF883 family membrane-anchored ribosome-binding protein
MKVTIDAGTPFATGNVTADAALNKASASLHAAVDKVAGAADDAARKVAPAIDRAAEGAHQALDRVAGVAAPTAAWLDEQSNSLKAAQRTMAADMSQYVAVHPWKSIGFALAAGFFIGRFLR